MTELFLVGQQIQIKSYRINQLNIFSIVLAKVRKVNTQLYIKSTNYVKLKKIPLVRAPHPVICISGVFADTGKIREIIRNRDLPGFHHTYNGYLLAVERNQ